MRRLKYHEQKLLKKTNFLEWENERNKSQIKTIRKYQLKSREEYIQYYKVCKLVYKLRGLLEELPPDDPMRREITNMLLDKLCVVVFLLFLSSSVRPKSKTATNKKATKHKTTDTEWESSTRGRTSKSVKTSLLEPFASSFSL